MNFTLGRAREWVAASVHFGDMFANGFLALACAIASLRLWEWSKPVLAAAGMPPRTFQGAWDLAMSPLLVSHLEAWGTGVAAVAVAALLAFSAAEGAWWTWRRLSRPT